MSKRPFGVARLGVRWLMLGVLTTSGVMGAQPPQRYSYYSPGAETVNLDKVALEPRLFRRDGRELPEELIVLTGVSRRLMRLHPNGTVRWLLNVDDGGGAYGLASYRGRILLAYGREVLVVDPSSGRLMQRFDLMDSSHEVLSFMRVQGDYLIAGDSSDRSRIVVAELSLNSRGEIEAPILYDMPTRTQYPRDALFLDDDTIAVADTFGHALALLKRKHGSAWREFRRQSVYFPNMLQASPRDDGDELYVLSEHANRIARWNLRTGERSTLVSCPRPVFENPYTTHHQVKAEEKYTATAEVPPRQVCAVDVAGPRTLYAANGFVLDGPDRVWVADADNHRVVLFVEGEFWGAIGNINHPIRLIPVSQL